MKNNLTHYLLFLFILIAQGSFAQLTISGSSDVVISEKDTTETYVIESDQKLSTSYTNQGRSTETIDLLAVRSASKVELIILFNGVIKPMDLIIERKSSDPLAKYSLVKTLTQNQIDSLYKNKRISIMDDFPTSRKLGAYYRVEYMIDEDISKVLPPVLLKGQSTQSEGLTSMEKNGESDKFSIETDEKTYEDYDISLNAIREGVFVYIDITGIGEFDFPGEWAIERKSSHYLSSYRKIKKLSYEELEEVRNNNTFTYVDKYPEPGKITSYYRLTCTQVDDNRIIELPAIEVPKEER